MKKQTIKTLRDLDFKDKNVFMRVDFNVPLKGKKILDSYRIEKSLPSIRFVLENGGRLLLASHLGRPKGKRDPQLSLIPLAEYLNQKEKLEVFFIEEPDNEAPKRLLPGLKKHQLILLENLRFHPGEEIQNNSFAKQLSSYTDIYINEAFGISHRQHTSVTLLPKECPYKALGFQFEIEIEKLNKIKTHKTKKPFLVILGGSKLKDKIPIMDSLIDQADEFLIGGLMAYTFLKASGKNVGSSFIEKSYLPTVSLFIERIQEREKKIFLPLDHIIERKGCVEKTDTENIPKEAVGRDIGSATLKLFQERIKNSRTLFWNGPMGFFEKEEFRSGTQGLAETIAKHKQAYRLVGGGHSASAVRNYEKDIDHVSTGGGASLSYLKGDKLPGLDSLTTDS